MKNEQQDVANRNTPRSLNEKARGIVVIVCN
ncbi:uncharacterized protein METZ01_LOCUS331636, partial [marine metagenome]